MWLEVIGAVTTLLSLAMFVSPLYVSCTDRARLIMNDACSVRLLSCAKVRV